LNKDNKFLIVTKKIYYLYSKYPFLINQSNEDHSH